MNKAVYVLLVCFLFAGCERPNLYSYRKDHEIVIDGKYLNWGNYTSYYSEKEKIVVNLINDDEYLYICLISRRHNLETQVMEKGLQIWFDADGGQKRIFGIRFPIGMRVMGMPLIEGRPKKNNLPENEDDRAEQIKKQQDLNGREFDKKLETLEILQEKIEVTFQPPLADKKMPPLPGFLGGGTKELLLEEAHKYGLEAKVGRENGYFVYQLKVPLKKSEVHPYAIEVKPDQPIGIGIEVQNTVSNRAKGPVSRSPQDNGGQGPSGEGGRGEMPDAMSGNGFDDEENVKIWAVINLAK